MSFGTIVLEIFLTVVGERALLVYSFITACRNASIASAVAVLAIAIPSDCPSVRPSHAGIVSKRWHVAGCSLHCQLQNVSSFVETKKYSPGTTPSP